MENSIELYHGGYCAVEYPEIRQDRFTKDFGPGFYCTNIKSQAERWALRYDTPIVSIYQFHNVGNLRILHFQEMTEEWLDFIVNCRNGKPHCYDIVIGAMADDQIYNYISDYFSGVINREQFWVMAKFKKPTHQINFCTLEGINQIKYINSEEVRL
ncbi:MAG: DUF3990 domain-containing protein [Bacteroidales bacterium]